MLYCVLLLELLLTANNIVLAIDVVTSALLYFFLPIHTINGNEPTKIPVLHAGKKSKELHTLHPSANGPRPFRLIEVSGSPRFNNCIYISGALVSAIENDRHL